MRKVIVEQMVYSSQSHLFHVLLFTVVPFLHTYSFINSPFCCLSKQVVRLNFFL